MCALCALQIFFSGPGQTYSISNWKSSYTEEFGWNQNQISFLYATATTTSACLMPFVGRAVDKYGQRHMSLYVSCGLVFACLIASSVNSSGICWFAFFLLRFFGQGSMTLIPNTVIPHWFSDRRGRAFSFTAIGGFISAVGFPLVDTWLIHTYGWRNAWIVLAIFIFMVFIPCAVMWYKNIPEDVGEICEGHVFIKAQQQQLQLELQQQYLHSETAETDTAIGTADTANTADKDKDENWTLTHIMQTRSFWVLMHCNLERAAVNTALTFFLRDIGNVIGISELQAASLLSIQAFIGFPVTLWVGFLLERIAVHHALACTFILQSIALLILIYAQNMSACILFAMVWGIASGFEQISLQMIWPAYYGKACLGAVSGSSMTSSVLGSAVGPMLWGWSYEYNGNQWNKILAWTVPWALFTGVTTFILARKPAFQEIDSNSTAAGSSMGSGGCGGDVVIIAPFQRSGTGAAGIGNKKYTPVGTVEDDEDIDEIVSFRHPIESSNINSNSNSNSNSSSNSNSNSGSRAVEMIKAGRVGRAQIMSV